MYSTRIQWFTARKLQHYRLQYTHDGVILVLGIFTYKLILVIKMDMIYMYKSPIHQSGIYDKHVIELGQYIIDLICLSLSLSLFLFFSSLSLC